MPPAEPSAKRGHRTKVLVAMEPRAYRTTFGSAIQALRPHVEVTVLEPEELEAQIAFLEPDLVISDLPKPVASDARTGWMEYCPNDETPARVCVGGRCERIEDPGLDDLLSVVDQADRSAGSGVSGRSSSNPARQARKETAPGVPVNAEPDEILRPTRGGIEPGCTRIR
jgi:hypothetical protein